MVPSQARLDAARLARDPSRDVGPARRSGRGARRPAQVTHLGGDDRSSQRVRLVDATLDCIARQGIQKTTVDDIARRAGVSRATLYRTFPGGKDAVLSAVVETETARLCAAVAVAMGGARDLPDVLVAGIVEATRRARAHPALSYLLAHEPETVLPYLAFGKLDHLLLAASTFAAPFFGRWLEPEQAARAAEWAVRIVLSYFLAPNARTDLSDPDEVRHIVRTFVVPGIQALRASAGGAGGPVPVGGNAGTVTTDQTDQTDTNRGAGRTGRARQPRVRKGVSR